MQTIKIGNRVFRVLFPELLRPLTTMERARLRESIRQCGIKGPVIVDEDGNVLDGINRLEIAVELGLEENDVPVKVWKGLDPTVKRELAMTLNRDRRHLTLEEQQEARQERIERVAQAKQQGQSTRQIADKEGVSQAQVRQDMKAATEQGCSVAPAGGKVVGKDGKSRPASVPSNKKAKASAVAANGREQAVDKEGFPLKGDMVTEFPRVVGLFEEAQKAIKNLQRLFDEIARSRIPVNFPRLQMRNKQHVSLWLEDQVAPIFSPQAMPWAACPWCLVDFPGRLDQAGKCKTCRGTNVVDQSTWRNSAGTLREELATLEKSKVAKGA